MDTLPPFSPEAEALQPGIYQHYKGARYKVHGVVRHSETLQEMVHYEHLDDGSQWVRPLNMFLETVTTPDGTKPRFHMVTW